MKHCETCHCGKIYVEWSDRGGYVDLNNPEDVADIVMNCALDHCYDRTGNGIPYNFPTDLENKLAPIVAKHLATVEPDWKNKSVHMSYDDGSRGAFKQELMTAVEESYA